MTWSGADRLGKASVQRESLADTQAWCFSEQTGILKKSPKVLRGDLMVMPPLQVNAVCRDTGISDLERY